MSVSYLPMLVFACAGLLLAQPAASLQQATLTRYTDNTCATQSKPQSDDFPAVVEYTLGVCNTNLGGLAFAVDCTDPQNPTVTAYDSCGASKKPLAAATGSTTTPVYGYTFLGFTTNPDKLKSAKCTKLKIKDCPYVELTCPTPASPPSPPNSVVDIVQYKDAHCTEKLPAGADGAQDGGTDIFEKSFLGSRPVLNNQCDANTANTVGMKISCADWKKPTVYWSTGAADTKNDCKPFVGQGGGGTTVYTAGKCTQFANPGGRGYGFVEITCAAPGSTPPPTAGSAPPASTGLGGGAIFGIIVAVLVGVAGLAAGALFFLKKGPFAPKGMGGASIYETSPGGNH